MKKTSVLMICLGNICRSPLAEGILKSKVDPDKVFVDSAATGDYHIGHAPDKRSIAVAKQNNLDITTQLGRQFGVSDFDKFDYIYVMDHSNYDNVIKLARNDEDKQKVKLILDEVTPGERNQVPDPYWSEQDGFTKVYAMLDEACDKIAEKIN